MPDKFNPLARYNAEVARGIMHTPEWDAQMAALQREYDGEETDLAGLDAARRWWLDNMPYIGRVATDAEVLEAYAKRAGQ
jgi:hypothetical protein